MIASPFVFLLLFFLTADRLEARDYCTPYHACLDLLGQKERECAKFPDSRTDALSDCQRKARRKKRVELHELQVKKVEKLSDCIALERKCRSAADKMEIVAELLLSPRGLSQSKQKRRKQNSKQTARNCRRSRKILRRKCKALSKCCSASEDCDARVSDLTKKIRRLRRELRPTNATAEPTC
ncbi:hypothetical protein M3Y99_00199300 [Aphelenchoides fujianensis]|nr:hypothetical protein M3Y99_00199300 [Aphelenchoides fujianensis]